MTVLRAILSTLGDLCSAQPPSAANLNFAIDKAEVVSHFFRPQPFISRTAVVTKMHTNRRQRDNIDLNCRSSGDSANHSKRCRGCSRLVKIIIEGTCYQRQLKPISTINSFLALLAWQIAQSLFYSGVFALKTLENNFCLLLFRNFPSFARPWLRARRVQLL